MVTATTRSETLTPFELRLARLRELSDRDPHTARDDAWEWFAEAGTRARSDRAGAIAELDELFRSGRPSRDIDGATEGRLVTFTVSPLFDRAIATLTGAWMPLLGKRFDSQAGTGDNLLARSARWPSRLPWPTYPMTGSDAGLVAFDFNTWIEPGAVDPDRDVLVIDYASVDSNPRVIIKQIRDELVEVVPGAHLGKMLWHHGDGPDARHTLLAFFALRSELSG
jgi:hypothetical protein